MLSADVAYYSLLLQHDCLIPHPAIDTLVLILSADDLYIIKRIN